MLKKNSHFKNRSEWWLPLEIQISIWDIKLRFWIKQHIAFIFWCLCNHFVSLSITNDNRFPLPIDSSPNFRHRLFCHYGPLIQHAAHHLIRVTFNNTTKKWLNTCKSVVLEGKRKTKQCSQNVKHREDIDGANGSDERSNIQNSPELLLER